MNTVQRYSREHPSARYEELSRFAVAMRTGYVSGESTGYVSGEKRGAV